MKKGIPPRCWFGRLVGFDFLCTSMASSNIEKNEKSASENVDFIGSTVDFDINKIFKIGQRMNIDAL